MQVQLPSAARDFFPMVKLQCNSLTAFPQPQLCNLSSRQGDGEAYADTGRINKRNREMTRPECSYISIGKPPNQTSAGKQSSPPLTLSDCLFWHTSGSHPHWLLHCRPPLEHEQRLLRQSLFLQPHWEPDDLCNQSTIRAKRCSNWQKVWITLQLWLFCVLLPGWVCSQYQKQAIYNYPSITRHGNCPKNQQKNRETGGWGGQGHHPIGKYFLTTFKSMQSGGISHHNFKAVFIILIITLFFYSKIGQCFETVWLEPDLYTPLQ